MEVNGWTAGLPGRACNVALTCSLKVSDGFFCIFNPFIKRLCIINCMMDMFLNNTILLFLISPPLCPRHVCMCACLSWLVQLCMYVCCVSVLISSDMYVMYLIHI